MLKQRIKVVAERLSEPSTWAGIGTLFVLFNVMDIESATQFSDIAAQVVGGLCAIVAIFTKEAK